MTSRLVRASLSLAIVILLPISAHAQLGRLKQLGKDMLEKKAGLTSQSSRKAPTQWKSGERVPPFSAADLDRFIASWNQRIEYDALSDAERERRDREKRRKQDEYDARHEKWENCTEKALTPDEAMQLQQQMAEKMMQLAQAGDENPSAKAVEWMQKALAQKTQKKCGSEPQKPASSESAYDYRMEEWVTAYLAVRDDSDAATAAKIVLASAEEAAALEARLDKLRQLVKGEPLASR